jgi:hypothetical protein
MNEWTDAGLPPTEGSGYSMSMLSELVRTSFDTPAPQQIRRNTANVQKLSLPFLFTSAQLRAARALIESTNYGWVEIPASPDGRSLVVRPIEDFVVSVVGELDNGAGPLYSATLVVETQPQ